MVETSANSLVGGEIGPTRRRGAIRSGEERLLNNVEVIVRGCSRKGATRADPASSILRRLAALLVGASQRFEISPSNDRSKLLTHPQNWISSS